MTSDTIFALASGRPPAAIALIRVSGPRAHGAARRLTGGLPQPRHAVVRKIRAASGELLDEALVLRFDAPRSATGEDVIELHCHGGRAVVDAVLSELGRLEGLRLALPGEFTRRAFESGRIDLTEAEGLADLLEAETEMQRKAAIALAEGGLRREIAAWEHQLVQLSARAEAAIDYVEEDGVGHDPSLASDCQALADELEVFLERPAAEPLKEGIKVALAGPPNAGKSSLLNAIAGSEKAIVTDIPGTTRDRIEVPLTIDGIPFVLVDTAGLRTTRDAVERIGVVLAEESVRSADIVIWMGDPEEAPEHRRLLLLHGRCDIPGRELVPEGSLAVSASTGSGLKGLLMLLTNLSSDILPAEGDLALNRRQRECLAEAQGALVCAATAGDIVIMAEELRSARNAFERLTGRVGLEDVLDALFGRFCLGK